MKEHNKYITIEGRKIGPGQPVFIIAEMSANHMQDINQAIKIVEKAKEAGADAIKLQTYTPDTITLNCSKKYFKIEGTIWEGKSLYDLYSEAYTPWDWHQQLQKLTNDNGMIFFSTPFDFTAVDFLEQLNVSVYKIASFENVDIPLIKKIARTGKPIIMSTGMATLSEIDEAVRTIRDSNNNNLALLKCTSSYPADPKQINLNTIPSMSDAFCCPVGISDHTMGIEIPIAAVSIGASIVEKHFTLDRSKGGHDSSFSLEPEEFKSMVEAIRNVEKALGTVTYEITEKEKASRVFRRSLFIASDMKKGDIFDDHNLRSIRPGHGLHTRYLEQIIGKSISRDIEKGTPLTWDLIV